MNYSDWILDQTIGALADAKIQRELQFRQTVLPTIAIGTRMIDVAGRTYEITAFEALPNDCIQLRLEKV